MTPVSTYRLQFGPRFSLDDAVGLVPYLAALGISHVYSSPLLRARPGSEHGYDITDHGSLNPEIGGWDAFVRFTDALRAHGMGLILDFVPNHMGIGKADNAWWLDVLEAGQSSPFADFFDIDWAPRRPELKGKVLLPILGDHYGNVLTGGELELRFDTTDGTLSAWYHDHRLPLRARSYAAVIRRQLARAGERPLAAGLRHVLERIADAFDRVRRAGGRRRQEARERAAALKAELAELCRRDEDAARFLDAAAAAYRGVPRDPESVRPLHALLERQFYRIAYWRVAADEINYRRFFNINDLAGVRIENRALFDAAHRLVGRMIGEGRLQGLRLDHIDGLYDPEGYCRRLHEFARSKAPAGSAPFYIVVEKILARHETLRESWPVAGTTGYEFANLLNGIFVDATSEAICTTAYGAFTGALPFEEVLPAAKDLVVTTILAGELGVLADELDRISERNWSTRDYTRIRLREALKSVVREFPVYRTYVSARGIAADDRRDIDWAVARARRNWRGADQEIFDFVREALTGEIARRGAPFRRADALRFAMHFQQYTGPVMAKALEDTSFYRYARLLSLNEVGGDPRQFGVSVPAFHHANRERVRRWPHAMVATSTHDTKRGEDARLRIDVISEIPDEWRSRVGRWSDLNRALRGEADGVAAPSRNDEYMLYQAMLGAWPTAFIEAAPEAPALADFAHRIELFLVKALREAKLETSWDNPNQFYEDACIAFVRDLFGRSPNPFLADFSAFAARVGQFAMLGGLSQAVLRLTVPGIPDTYQGSELWNFSLVDPDNRQNPDFPAMAKLLERVVPLEGMASELRAAKLADEREHWFDGRIKLRVTREILRLRRAAPNLFRSGWYEPIGSTGARAGNLVAYLRRWRGERVLVVAGRLFAPLLGHDIRVYDGTVWGDTAILLGNDDRGRWRDVLSGEVFALRPGMLWPRLPAATLLSRLPAAVLVRERR